MSDSDELAKIAALTRYEACRLWRFAKIGHPWMVSGTVVGDAFAARFKELGGFSPEISKELGW